MSKKISIDESYLKELIGFLASKTVGKILKKADILGASDTLKNIIKESLYEEFREVLYSIQYYEVGQRTKVIEIKGRE